MVCGVRYTEWRRLNFPVMEQWYYVMYISSFNNKIKVELDLYLHKYTPIPPYFYIASCRFTYSCRVAIFSSMNSFILVCLVVCCAVATTEVKICLILIFFILFLTTKYKYGVDFISINTHNY